VKRLIALAILAAVFCMTAAVGCSGSGTSKGGTSSTGETKSSKT
jgi:hypothetical protein